ncbi:MAG: hypothetical protein ACREQ9_09415 [Candidatus Binatia bacterium]
MVIGRCLFLTMLVAAAAAGGCAARSAEPEPAEQVAELFPLRPGTFWVYRVQDFDGQVTLQRVLVRGKLYLKTLEAPGMVVDESGGVSGELSLDVEWHPVVYYRRGDFLYKFSGLDYDGEKLREVRLGIGEEKVLPSDPFRYPAWESDFEVFRLNEQTAYGIRTYSIAEQERAPVEVHAGTFDGCVRVETRSVTRHPRGRVVLYRYLDWYAPGVGLVKSVVEVDDAPRPVRNVELISFRPGSGD